MYDKAHAALRDWRSGDPTPSVDNETIQQIISLMDEQQEDIDLLEEEMRHSEAFLEGQEGI